MTSLESNEIVMTVMGETLTACVIGVITTFSEDFGENGLEEILMGLSQIALGDEEYIREDFADPEFNFKLNYTN